MHIYERIMARPPTGTCDLCKTAPATTWFGQTSVAHCGAKVCLDACLDQQRQTQARIEQEAREEDDPC